MEQKKRILIVDDEPSITRLLKLNLEQTRNYEVIVENSAARVLRTALACRPDLILLDILMPGKDGGQLASEIRASARLSQVPIVFLTAAATKAEVRSHRGFIGGLPFLAKPVDLGEVIGCIRHYLGDHHAGPAQEDQLISPAEEI